MDFLPVWLDLHTSQVSLLPRHCPKFWKVWNVIRIDISAVIIGVVASLGVFALFSWYRDRREIAGAEWAQREIYRRLPLACIASPW